MRRLVYCTASFSIYLLQRAKFPIIYPVLWLDYKVATHPAIMLAIAFLFWAANQLWPDLPQATLFNDFAIALFVLDVFLVTIGWPTTSPDESDKSASCCPAEFGSRGERFEPAPEAEEPSI